MKPIIIIGPIGAGKSTIAKMVAEELSIPSFSLDKEEHLAASVGYDIERYKRMWKENGLPPIANSQIARVDSVAHVAEMFSCPISGNGCTAQLLFCLRATGAPVSLEMACEVRVVGTHLWSAAEVLTTRQSVTHVGNPPHSETGDYSHSLMRLTAQRGRAENSSRGTA